MDKNRGANRANQDIPIGGEDCFFGGRLDKFTFAIAKFGRKQRCKGVNELFANHENIKSSNNIRLFHPKPTR